MKIRSVKNFEAFDMVQLNSRGAHTLVSLDLDGKRYYSIMLDGIRHVSSGKDVTVAFRDDEEKSVLAWTDPTSQEFFHVDGITSVFACFFIILLSGLLLAKFTGIFGMGTPIPELGFSTILVSTCIVIARILVRRTRLKSAMRRPTSDTRT